MKTMFTPIDVESITRNALRGYGPGDSEPVVKRYRWLRRQPAEPPKSAPAARRSRADEAILNGSPAAGNAAS